MTLTAQQIMAVRRGEPVHLVPEELGQEVVVIRGDLFSNIADLVDDWDPRVMRQSMARMMEGDWSDPAMRIYDE